MTTDSNILSPKKPNPFICEVCHFKCSYKRDYERHLLTKKHNIHILATNNNDLVPNNSKKYECLYCDKIFNDRTGLWRHKKKCNIQEDTTILMDASSNLIMELLKQNNEFKELLVEQNKQLIEMANKIGNTNCNNNTKTNNFNLHLFLNEKCKDALNIDEFVNQIQLKLSDLDMLGQLGYTEGMSKIIIRNLQELDVFKRPIHCSDLKRETMYVKDKDAWEKENGENVKIKKVIKCIEHKNIKQIPQWVQENPASEDTDTKKHMEYKNIVLEAMGGSTLEDDNKKREKIIRNIAKEVVIDKTMG
jgi:hypothetical protein